MRIVSKGSEFKKVRGLTVKEIKSPQNRFVVESVRGGVAKTVNPSTQSIAKLSVKTLQGGAYRKIA